MAESQAQQGQFVIQKIYVKDSSFEAPNTPQAFTQQKPPSVNLQLGNTTSKVQDGVYEVVLSVTVTATQDDKTTFLVEIQQAGVFAVQGFPEPQLDQMLNAYCPNLLFPFAREAVSDMVIRGGFPQLLLNPVNFDALYAQQLQQRQGAQAPN
jgi:preprotein translocase subunit SecB